MNSLVFCVAPAARVGASFVSSLIDQVDGKVACAQRDFSRSQRARYLLAGGLWRSSNCALAETQEQRFSNPLGNLALRVAATLPDLVNSRATAWAWSCRCHPH